MREKDSPLDAGHWLDFASAVLMAAAVVGTAYSIWQSTVWNSEEGLWYAEAASTRLESAKALTIAENEIEYDSTVFSELAIRYADFFDSPEVQQEAQQLADLLIRSEFRPALDAWIASDPLNNPDAAISPFELEQYRNENLEEGERLRLEAEANLVAAQEASGYADDYILATVFFASVLFFAGIATKLRSAHVQGGILVLALAGLGIAFWRVATLPLA